MLNKSAQFISIDGQDAPYFSYTPSQEESVSDTVIQFSSANGIPVESYESFFEHLPPQYSISCLDSRGTWPERRAPKPGFSWCDHASDLIKTIEQTQTQPVIGIGHSMGGIVNLEAARRRPDLFSKLIIIDPASTPTAWMATLFKLMPYSVALRFAPFIARTAKRQHIWESPQTFIDNYQGHPTYRPFTTKALKDYAEYGLQLRPDNQYELRYLREWEAHNFRKVDYFWKFLKRVDLPVLVMRAEKTYITSAEKFSEETAKLKDYVTALTINGAHHLVTHEQPRELGKTIGDWLEN